MSSGQADPPSRRAAIRITFTGAGMSLEAAGRWCDAWELEAAGRGLSKDGDYWTPGASWIAEEKAARRPAW